MKEKKIVIEEVEKNIWEVLNFSTKECMTITTTKEAIRKMLN